MGDVIGYARVSTVDQNLDSAAGAGIQFKSLTEPFDTTDHGGELFFHIVTAFAQMQRRQISEKTRAGLAAAKARGRLGGRPTVMDPDRVALAKQMRAEGKSFDDIAALLRVGASSVKRALREGRVGLA